MKRVRADLLIRAPAAAAKTAGAGRPGTSRRDGGTGRVRILGVDPGLRVTGFGIIEQCGTTLTYVTSGCVRSDAGSDLPARLHTILQGLGEIIAEHRPQSFAVEKVFVNVNPASTLLLGQARGTAICAAVIAKLPVVEYTALQIKQAVVGHGHARKEQVQDMVRRLLNLSGLPGADAADALACAICHAYGAGATGVVAASLRAASERAAGERAAGVRAPGVADAAGMAGAAYRRRRGRMLP